MSCPAGHYLDGCAGSIGPIDWASDAHCQGYPACGRYPGPDYYYDTKLYLLDGLAKLNWCFYIVGFGYRRWNPGNPELSADRFDPNPNSWNTGPRSILVHDTTLTGRISLSTATSTVDTTVDISNVAFRPSNNRRESGLFCVGPCRIVNSSFVGSALSLGVNSTVPANITGNLFANYTANDTRGALTVRSYTGASITNNTFVNNSTALSGSGTPNSIQQQLHQ